MAEKKPIDIIVETEAEYEAAQDAKLAESRAKIEAQLEVMQGELNAAKAIIAKTEGNMKFMAKYATDALVGKNFGLLQDIIEDEPTYVVVETPTGAKTIRESGTEQKDRIAAINAFFKYNLAQPSEAVKGAQNLHIHGDTSAIMNKFLTMNNKTSGAKPTKPAS